MSEARESASRRDLSQLPTSSKQCWPCPLFPNQHHERTDKSVGFGSSCAAGAGSGSLGEGSLLALCPAALCQPQGSLACRELRPSPSGPRRWREKRLKQAGGSRYSPEAAGRHQSFSGERAGMGWGRGTADAERNLGSGQRPAAVLGKAELSQVHGVQVRDASRGIPAEEVGLEGEGQQG